MVILLTKIFTTAVDTSFGAINKMNNKLLFHLGQSLSNNIDNDNILEVITQLKTQQDYLYNQEIDDLIKFFDKLSDNWRNNKGLENKMKGTLKHLAEFIKADNITKMLNFSLRGDYHVLDKFIDFDQPDYLYTCQPRGLVVHWIAGNVPLLGFYSIIQSILTKNVSLVKASSQAHEELLMILESIKSVETDNVRGEDIVKTVSVVLIDRNDLPLQNILSHSADVRVAWGGEEAISTIINLKKSIFSEDIIFGPKYSYGVIDREALEDYQPIAQRLAFDVSTFDQYACSSPHTVFVEQGGKITPKDFAKELAQAMDLVNKKMVPKTDFQPKKNMDILLVRAKHSMDDNGTVISSKNCDWTVIYIEEKGLANPCFSRVIYVKPIENWADISQFNTQKIQTLGCSIKNKDKLNILRTITRKGVDRCPKFGEMTLYESPWDGFFPLDKMVRWVKSYK